MITRVVVLLTALLFGVIQPSMAGRFRKGSKHSSSSSSSDASETPESRCDGGPIPLHGDILVEARAFRGSTVSQEEVAILEQVFIDSYNTLDTCSQEGGTYNVEFVSILLDPQDRVGSRHLEDDSTLFDFDVLKFQMSVGGFCRGCPQGTLLFNDVDDTRRGLKQASWEPPRGMPRRLGRKSKRDQHCDCPPPDETDVLQAVNQNLDELVADGNLTSIVSFEDMVELELVDCVDEISVFTSTDILQGRVDPNLISAEEISDLQRTFLETYNTLNLLGETCDVLFRRVTNVSIDIQDETLPIRELRDGGGDEATSSPFFGYSAFLTVTYTGECRGCPDSSSLYNDVDSSRVLENALRMTTSSFGSSCLCPIGAPRRPPSEAEFQQALVEALPENNVTFLLDIEDLGNAEPVECSSTRSGFHSQVGVEAHLFDLYPSYEQLSRLSQLALDAYNGLNAFRRDICDPLFHRVTHSYVWLYGHGEYYGHRRLEETVSGSETVVFTFGGECRGCPAVNTQLLTEDGSNDGPERNLRKLRGLEYEEAPPLECYCFADAVGRLPTDAEFLAALNEAVEENESIDFVDSFHAVVDVDIYPQ